MRSPFPSPKTPARTAPLLLTLALTLGACNELGQRDCVDVEGAYELPGRMICGVIDHQSGGFQVLARNADTLELLRWTEEHGFQQLTKIEGIFSNAQLTACPRFSPGIRLGGISAYHHTVQLAGQRSPDGSTGPGIDVANARLVAINNAGETEGTVKPSPDTHPFQVNDLLLDSKGTVVIAGARWSPTSNALDDTRMWVAGLNGRGQIKWQFSGDEDNVAALALVRSGSTKLIVRSRVEGQQHERLQRYSGVYGTSEWTLKLDAASRGFDGLTADGEEGAYLTGLDDDGAEPNLVIMRITNAGVLVWQHDIPAPEGWSYAQGRGSAVTGNDDYLLAAHPVQSSDTDSRSTLLMGIDPDGDQRCMQIVDEDHGYPRTNLGRSPTRIVVIHGPENSTSAHLGSRLVVLKDLGKR